MGDSLEDQRIYIGGVGAIAGKTQPMSYTDFSFHLTVCKPPPPPPSLSSDWIICHLVSKLRKHGGLGKHANEAYEQLNALLRFLYNRETAKDGGSSSKAAGSDALSQIFGWFNTTYSLGLSFQREKNATQDHSQGPFQRYDAGKCMHVSGKVSVPLTTTEGCVIPTGSKVKVISSYMSSSSAQKFISADVTSMGSRRPSRLASTKQTWMLLTVDSSVEAKAHSRVPSLQATHLNSILSSFLHVLSG